MKYINWSTRFFRWAAALVLMAVCGCVGGSEWVCRRSSECPKQKFCRVGRCVPAVGFVPESASEDAGIGADSTWSKTSDTGALVVEGCPEGSPPKDGQLVINEVLANVPAGEAGDANADGARDAYDDEFVEIVNTSDHLLDVTSVVLKVGEDDKFSFESTCLKSKQAAVIYGGGHPAPQTEFLVRVARTSLSLSNSGGNISLVGPEGAVLDSMAYTDADPEALTLSPQLDGEQFVAHSGLSPDVLFSPGTCPQGRLFSEGCADPEPVEEP